MIANDPISQFCELSIADLEEFGEEFSKFSLTAFRLELLPAYNVEDEVEAFNDYSDGRPRPVDFNSEWAGILEAAGRRGAKFSRVRLVDEMWDKSYLNFETEWGYKYSVNLGESIQTVNALLLRSIAAECNVSIFLDYWIFDDSKMYMMQYDAFGQFCGVLKATKELVEIFRIYSKRLIEVGKPIQF